MSGQPVAWVHIIGTGLLGTSLGLALTDAHYHVTLEDLSPTAQTLAADLGAGQVMAPGSDAQPDIVVVATPPDVAAQVIITSLRRFTSATVVDIASVKSVILHAVRAAVEPAELDRYIGCHPMAGREKSGAIAARGDLFIARPWVVCSDADTPPERLQAVVTLVNATGAALMHLEPEAHDAAVAKVSHVPQIVASLVAAQLREMDWDSVALAGQGLRDVTRIAASDPGLWTQILTGNAAEIQTVLRDVQADLATLIAALDLNDGATGVIARTLAAGNDGHAMIPGKHGQAPTTYTDVTVLVDDTPGALGKLFADIGELGINIEDFHMDHAPGMKVGIVDISVVPAAAHELITGLSAKSWTVAEAAVEAEPATPAASPHTTQSSAAAMEGQA